MKRLILMAWGAVILTGCVSAAKREAADEMTCQRWGAQAGSRDFVECMLLLRRANALEDERRAAQLQVIGASLQNAGAAIQATSPPPPRAVMCNSFTNGPYTNTTCN